MYCSLQIMGLHGPGAEKINSCKSLVFSSVCLVMCETRSMLLGNKDRKESKNITNTGGSDCKTTMEHQTYKNDKIWKRSGVYALFP